LPEEEGMINHQSLAEEIRATLREQVLSGVLSPGQRLTEQGVAQQMGTSPGPVREAFASLWQEGLLISLPRRGTFVTTASEVESLTAYEIRARIEPYAAELAMPRADDSAIARLETALAGMRAAAVAHDLLAHIQHDMAFHGVFYDLSGSELLRTVWAATSAKIQQFIGLAAPHYVPDLGETAEQHAVLLALFRAQDADGLRAAIVPHVGDLWRRIRAVEATDVPASRTADSPPIRSNA
jgi:DNA-binding GntR family transcriptional regulator